MTDLSKYTTAQLLSYKKQFERAKEWDLQIFSIVKFFELCRQNNPNMIDTLFTPENCVIHCTQIGRMVRDNRKLFLSKEAWKKFRGYAHAQLKKMNDKDTVHEGEDLRAYEDEHDIPNSTKLSTVEAELRKRGLMPRN